MHLFSIDRSTRRRGAAAVFTIIILVVLIGFASLTVDVGALYNTRADLQNAADAAALSAASAYTSDAMVQVRLGNGSSDYLSVVAASATAKAQDISQRNYSFGGDVVQLEATGVTIGRLDMTSATSPINPGAAAATYNAIQVLVERSNDGPNGPLNLFFAPIFGKQSTEVSASATAVFDDRLSEYDPTAPDAPYIWPFTISESEYDNWVALAGDNYAYGGGAVSSGADGLLEVQLYPADAGNYGLLNIGTPNNGTGALITQITNGVTPSDLQAETGYTVLTFVDAGGDPTTYSINGNPGTRSTLKDSLADRIGDVVAFFLHESVDTSGSDNVYQVTQMRFGRVMHVHYTGPPSGRGLWVQPITYTGPAVTTRVGARSTNGAAGRIVLAR